MKRIRTAAQGPARPPITNGTPLQLLLAQRMDELGREIQGYPLTYQQVVDRAARGSRRPISKASVGNILNGKTIALTPERVKALARALDLDATLIEQAIEQTKNLTYELPAQFRRLSPEGWRQLLELGEFLLAKEGKARPRNGRG